MIQIAAVTITTHQCLIVCNTEITRLIVTLKSVCVSVCVGNMGVEGESVGVFVIYISI